jgi:hypothetical protein
MGVGSVRGRPSRSRADWNAGALAFSGEGPSVDVELWRDGLQRATRLVSPCGLAHEAVGHLADDLPPLDASSVEVVDDRRAVHAELRGQRVDRRPVAVGADDLVHVVHGQSPLHRVGEPSLLLRKRARPTLDGRFSQFTDGLPLASRPLQPLICEGFTARGGLESRPQRSPPLLKSQRSSWSAGPLSVPSLADRKVRFRTSLRAKPRERVRRMGLMRSCILGSRCSLRAPPAALEEPTARLLSAFSASSP